MLTGLIDYAGLFPPATLDMASATRNFAKYSLGPDAPWLGRFVIPVERLGEYEQAVKGLEKSEQPWRLSALSSVKLERDLGKIAEFNERHTDDGVLIDTIEIKAMGSTEIESAMGSIPGTLTPYFEISMAGDPIDLIKAIAATGARAKVRAGGVSVESFPPPFNLARFIKSCADEDVAFKATAGLHHALRSINKLTAEPESPRALMHGFLNLFLAAAFAQVGVEREWLVELLEERSLEAFQLEEDSVHWRGHLVVRSHVRNSRRLFAVAFGSCSFEEPVGELRKLGLL
ncbi:MAG TPA: hypothetical protein VJ302_21775 [Blastocatellia bacterium]|nr:hypothetical protein [Blastocatellia bacterium]